MILIADLSLARVVQHLSFQFYAFAYNLYRPELSLRSADCMHLVQCKRMRMTTITLRVQILTLSIYKWGWHGYSIYVIHYKNLNISKQVTL